MVTIGRQATGLDAARRGSRRGSIAAGKRNDGEAAETFQIFGHCARIASTDVAAAGALMPSTCERSSASVFARRTIPIATFSFALMSLAVFHSLALVLAMEFRLIRALQLLSMTTTPAFALSCLSTSGASTSVTTLIAAMLVTFQ